MDLSPLAALAAKFPTKAADILQMAAAGKTDSEIAAALTEQVRADEVAAAKAEAVAAKSAADKAAADLKAEQDKSAALAAKVAELEAKAAEADKRVGQVAALAAGAAKDPGADAPAVKTITRAEYERSPSAFAADVASGSVKIIA